MTIPDVNLGGRLPLISPDTLEGDQKKLYEQMHSTLIPWAEANGFKGITADGKLIGPFKSLSLQTDHSGLSAMDAGGFQAHQLEQACA